MHWIIFDLWMELLLYKRDLHSSEDLSKEEEYQKKSFEDLRT
jgi:hypothetical protein